MEQEREEDEAWLAEGAPDARALRMEVVAQHWPHLVASFNQLPEKAAKYGCQASGTLNLASLNPNCYSKSFFTSSELSAASSC